MSKVKYEAIFIDDERHKVFATYTFDSYDAAEMCIETAIAMNKIKNRDSETMSGITRSNTIIRVLTIPT